MTSLPRPQSGLDGNHGDHKQTERGSHGSRGPALPPGPPRLPLGCCHERLRQGCTAVRREGCRAGGCSERGVGLEWEYLGSV